MTEPDYMVRLNLDDAELKSRRAFFEITDDDLALLASARPFAERHMDEFVEELYVLILGHPETRRIFANDGVVRRVQAMQKQYFLGVFSGRCDLAYVADRLRIGVAHERVGVAPKWYIGAYGRYLRQLLARLVRDIPEPAKAQAIFASATKVVAFDMALAMDTYLTAKLEAIARHQAAIRELSTPVIQLHDRILLLPLVGTLDTQRAEQVMETVLMKVVEHQAAVIITDIAGVAVVDTKVADHLLQTTQAVRLLGAESILTGISPLVAKTIVRLGIDITAMHTRSHLAAGVELAHEFVRRGAQPRAHQQPTQGTE
ncbi:MAG: protoglobin domain-containing protein [Deltaproteobacteria bacterium]|nr:protoglobin domain-containing protein [Deltaproteobacteria bacterium]